MKHIKRIVFLSVLLALVVACLAFPVSAAESFSDISFSLVDYFGEVAMFEADSWYYRFERGGVFDESEDYILKTEGNRAYFVFDKDNDGVSEKYPLVYDTLQGLTFVNSTSRNISVSYDDMLYYSSQGYTNKEILQVEDHYILECELNFSYDGQVVSLRYPSNIRFWQDLVLETPPVNDVLGNFRFEVSDRYVYLVKDLASGGSEKYILLNSSNNPIYSTDSIFSGNSAESSLISLVPVCEDGLHSFTQQILSAATCVAPGSKVITCSKCSYVSEVVIPAVGHNFDVLIAEQPAKCPDLGYKTLQCSRCSERKTLSLPLEHNYTVATCTEDSHCTGCGKVVALPTGHNYSWGKCTRCGDLWILPGDQGNDSAVGGFVENAGNALEDGWNNIVDFVTGGGADEGGGGSDNTDGGAGGGDGDDSNWFLDWLGLGDLGKKMGSFVMTIMAIGGICLVIGFWPKISTFFKWVWKGVVFTWNSLKDFFKSIGNSVSKSSRSRKGKNKKRTKK